MRKNLEKKNKNFFNKIAKYYDNGIFKNWFTRALIETLKIVNIKENSKILDMGCGTGNLLQILEKQNKNLKLYGIDISEEMIKISERKLKENVTFSLQSAEKMNFKNESFDYIFSTEAFHHYYDYELVMKNIHRVLKKKGYLIILDLDFGFILNKIFHLIEPGNNKMHSPSEFKNLFKHHNLKNIKQKRIGLFFILTIGEK